MTKTKQPKITIRLDQIEWKNFPDHTNGVIERHLDANPPLSSLWGIITKTDGTAGQLCDLTPADTLGVVAVLHDILNVEAGDF